MRRLLLFLLVAVIPALGQNLSTSGNIATSSPICGGANCVYYQLPPSTPWVVTTISGTWTGTINIVLINAPNATYSNLNSVAWNTVATVTSNGNWSVSAAGATFVLVEASALASGTAQVTMTASQTGAPLTNPVFSGNVYANGLCTTTGCYSFGNYISAVQTTPQGMLGVLTNPYGFLGNGIDLDVPEPVTSGCPNGATSCRTNQHIGDSQSYAQAALCTPGGPGVGNCWMIALAQAQGHAFGRNVALNGSTTIDQEKQIFQAFQTVVTGISGATFSGTGTLVLSLFNNCANLTETITVSGGVYVTGGTSVTAPVIGICSAVPTTAVCNSGTDTVDCASPTTINVAVPYLGGPMLYQPSTTTYSSTGQNDANRFTSGMLQCLTTPNTNDAFTLNGQTITWGTTVAIGGSCTQAMINLAAYLCPGTEQFTGTPKTIPYCSGWAGAGTPALLQSYFYRLGDSGTNVVRIQPIPPFSVPVTFAQTVGTGLSYTPPQIAEAATAQQSANVSATIEAEFEFEAVAETAPPAAYAEGGIGSFAFAQAWASTGGCTNLTGTWGYTGNFAAINCNTTNTPSFSGQGSAAYVGYQWGATASGSFQVAIYDLNGTQIAISPITTNIMPAPYYPSAIGAALLRIPIPGWTGGWVAKPVVFSGSVPLIYGADNHNASGSIDQADFQVWLTFDAPNNPPSAYSAIRWGQVRAVWDLQQDGMPVNFVPLGLQFNCAVNPVLYCGPNDAGGGGYQHQNLAAIPYFIAPFLGVDSGTQFKPGIAASNNGSQLAYALNNANATTVNGAPVPANQSTLGSNSNSQIIPGPVSTGSYDGNMLLQSQGAVSGGWTYFSSTSDGGYAPAVATDYFKSQTAGALIKTAASGTAADASNVFDQAVTVTNGNVYSFSIEAQMIPGNVIQLGAISGTTPTCTATQTFLFTNFNGVTGAMASVTCAGTNTWVGATYAITNPGTGGTANSSTATCTVGGTNPATFCAASSTTATVTVAGTVSTATTGLMVIELQGPVLTYCRSGQEGFAAAYLVTTTMQTFSGWCTAQSTSLTPTIANAMAAGGAIYWNTAQMWPGKQPHNGSPLITTGAPVAAGSGTVIQGVPLGSVGTIGGVTAGTGLNGGGTTGTVTLNLNTALPNGETATTQTAGDNSGKVASTAYVDSRIQCRISTPILNTGSTSLNEVNTCTIPAGTMGINSHLVLDFWVGACTAGSGTSPAPYAACSSTTSGNTGTCIVKIFFSGTSGSGGVSVITSGAIAAAHGAHLQASVSNEGSLSAQMQDSMQYATTSSVGATAANTVNTASNSFLNFYLQNSATADQCGLDPGYVTLVP